MSKYKHKYEGHKKPFKHLKCWETEDGFSVKYREEYTMRDRHGGDTRLPVKVVSIYWDPRGISTDRDSEGKLYCILKAEVQILGAGSKEGKHKTISGMDLEYLLDPENETGV